MQSAPAGGFCHQSSLEGRCGGKSASLCRKYSGIPAGRRHNRTAAVASGGTVTGCIQIYDFRCGLTENTALFQLIMAADPHLCQTHFAPCGLYAEGHMLEVVVIEKDTLQVIDDEIEGSV